MKENTSACSLGRKVFTAAGMNEAANNLVRSGANVGFKEYCRPALMPPSKAEGSYSYVSKTTQTTSCCNP
jgi:hypothetical protein